jgi:hypothetical protein
MGSLSISDTIRAISDDKSLALFNTVALASRNTDILKTTLKLTRRQYYSRMSDLVKGGLIVRNSRKYFLTSFGKVVYEAQMIIGKAVEAYWKLKAIDSFETSFGSPRIPAQEYSRIIDTLMEGNNEIKEILLKNMRNTQKDEDSNKEELIIPTALV